MSKSILVSLVLLLSSWNVFGAKLPVTNGVPNLHKLTDSIYRGGRANEEGIAYLASLGTKTIINFEFDEAAIKWERAEAKKYGIKYISRPMQYKVAPTDAEIDKILGMMQDPKNYPLYIHCRHGKDRTGIVSAIFNVEVLGWTPERAYKDMLDKGFARWHRALEAYFKNRAAQVRKNAA